jgi:hypothetical protein
VEVGRQEEQTLRSVRSGDDEEVKFIHNNQDVRRCRYYCSDFEANQIGSFHWKVDKWHRHVVSAITVVGGCPNMVRRLSFPLERLNSLIDACRRNHHFLTCVSIDASPAKVT